MELLIESVCGRLQSVELKVTETLLGYRHPVTKEYEPDRSLIRYGSLLTPWVRMLRDPSLRHRCLQKSDKMPELLRYLDLRLVRSPGGDCVPSSKRPDHAGVATAKVSPTRAV